MNLNVLLMALTVITLNANGLHDRNKWSDFWSEVPKCDVICVQETHLTPAQEYSFRIFAQSYDFTFSHGTSNSAGIFVAVRRNTGVMAVKSGEIPGRLLALDLNHQGDSFWVINVYALNHIILHRGQSS